MNGMILHTKKMEYKIIWMKRQWASLTIGEMHIKPQ